MSTLCRKLKLFVVGDKDEIKRVYDFLSNGQYAQYQALNLGMGVLTSSYYANGRDLKSPEFKDTQKSITNSNPIFNDIEFARGVDTLSLAVQKIKQDFSTSLKSGLAKGERCINNYKRATPLLTRGRDLKFFSSNDTDIDTEYLKEDFEFYISWVNKIKFKVVLGNPYKSQYLRSELKKIIQGEFKILGSSIGIIKKTGVSKNKSNGNKSSKSEIILNLTLSVPNKNLIPINPTTSVGVCLGVEIPAVCCLNDSVLSMNIGNREDFFIARQKIQAQLRNEQRRMRIAKGGHGRVKKLKSLERFKLRERNFVTTYNHYVSKCIVDFAMKNKAQYIVMEAWSRGAVLDDAFLEIEDGAVVDPANPSKATDPNWKCELMGKIVLRNWSYYQLQQYVEYKAQAYNIGVRYIDITDRQDLDEWSTARKIASS